MTQSGSQNGNVVGVVLLQLGGPDSPEAIEPFLYNLFSDPDIIDFPFARLARPTLARLIASRRARKLQEHYAGIGGKSPLRELTELQAAVLEKELRKTLDARVLVAMRYWHPLTEEVVKEIDVRGFRQLVLLPLYPQYSRTTTGSSLNEWYRRYPPAGQKALPTRVITDFYRHPLYLDAVVERINQGLAAFAECDASRSPARRAQVAREGSKEGCEDRPSSTVASRTRSFDEFAPDDLLPRDVYMVFSAHGVPMSIIEAGDPYRVQVEETVKQVVEGGRWPNPHCLCYQSRVGPGRWLAPSLREALTRLAARGVGRVLVIPIAFVSDHVETLYEIDIESREYAERRGIREFRTMQALNDSPKFIRALADLVMRDTTA